MMSGTDRSSLHSSHPVQMGGFGGFIDRLQQELTCRLIMTPWVDVQDITGKKNGPEVKDSASKLMSANQFSCVPLTNEKQVIGLFLRFEPNGPIRFEASRDNHFQKPDLDLISLLQHMRDSEQIAIIAGNADEPEGLVTYADFSKRPARVLFFAIVAEIESLLAAVINEVHTRDAWLDLLEVTAGGESDPRAELSRRKEEAEQWDALMPLTTFAEIGHLIQVVERSPDVRRRLGDDGRIVERLASLPDLRNRVAHAVRPVIAGPRQIKSVANQIDLMLEWIHKWESV